MQPLPYDKMICDSDLGDGGVYFYEEYFEWLNTHYEYEPVSLQDCLKYYNEPIFYYYVKECKCDVESKDIWGKTPLHIASMNGCLSIVEYLREECHAK